VIRTHVAYVLGSAGGRDGAAQEGDDDDGDGAAESDDQDDADGTDSDLLLEPLAAVPDRRGGNFRRPAEGRASDLSADDPRAWVVVKGNDDDTTDGASSSSSAWLRLRRAATLAECLSEAARRSGPTERPMLLHARVERVAAAAGGRGGVGGGGNGAPVLPLPPPPPVLWLSDGTTNASSSSSSSAMFVHTWHVPLLHAPSYLTNGRNTPLLSADNDDANSDGDPPRVRCSAVALKRGSLPTDSPPLMPPAAMAVELGPGRFDRDVASQGRWLGDAVRWALEEELGGARGGRRGDGSSAATLLPPAGVQLRGWVLARVASVSATGRGSNATAAAASRTWTTRVVRLFCSGGNGAGGGGDDASLPLLLADAREALGDAFLPAETLAIWSPRLLRAPPGLSETGGLMLCFAEDAAPLVSQGGSGSNEPAATVSHVVVRGPEVGFVARCVAARATAVSGGDKGQEEGDDEEATSARLLLRALRTAAVLPLDALRRFVDAAAADSSSVSSIDSLPRRLVALGVVSGLRFARDGGSGNGGGDGAPSSSSASSSSSFVRLCADLLDPQTGSAVPLALSLRRDGRLLADLRDGHALLLCGARLVAAGGGGGGRASPSSPASFTLEWAEAWSGRADRAARGCDVQDLCAMPAALSTARVRALGGFGSSSSLAALLSLPASTPRPLFAVVKGLRLRALRAVVCRVHSACGRRVETLSAADMMGGSFDTEDDEQEGGGGGGDGGGLAALSLADKQEEQQEDKALDPEAQARSAALAEWWRAWGSGQRRGRQGRRRFRVVLERATSRGEGGSDDDDGSGDDEEEDEDRLCSTDEEEEPADENKPPVKPEPFAAFKTTQDKPEKKTTTTTTSPLSFFSCAFCACELAVSGGGNGGQSFSNTAATVSRAYRDDGLKGARMLLEDASLAAPLAADGVAWRAALGGVPASRAASGGRAARRACAAAAEACSSSSESGSGGATWDALLYWRSGEWRVAAMQVSVASGGENLEEEEEGL
jgi:hypothetical protein